MNPQLPCVSKRLHLFWLSRSVLDFAVLDVTLLCRHLPVRSELDAIGGVHVDHLNLALQPLLLRERGHHEEGVAKDQSVGPVLVVLIELDQLLELDAVEIAPEVQLRFPSRLLGTQVVDERLRMDLLLDVDRHRSHFERTPVLLVLALPDKLWVQRCVAWVENRLRLLVLVGEERAKLGGRDVAAARLLVDGRLDSRPRSLFLRHRTSPFVHAPRSGCGSRPLPCTDRAAPCSPTPRGPPTG